MTITIRIQDDLAVLSIKGRFTYDLTQPFREAADQIGRFPALRRIEVDLSEATYIDSSALGLLLTLRDTAIAKGLDIRLTKVAGNVRQVILLAHFDRLFTIDG